MENNYEVVPNIISCKDLDYLSDMFNWNYGAYKSTSNAINLTRSSNVFQGNISKILDILNRGGNNE